MVQRIGSLTIQTKLAYAKPQKQPSDDNMYAVYICLLTNKRNCRLRLRRQEMTSAV